MLRQMTSGKKSGKRKRFARGDELGVKKKLRLKKDSGKGLASCPDGRKQVLIKEA